MRKRLSIKTRRPDLSRSEFRHYYETCHVPLGLSFINHFKWLRYVRNHVRSSSGSLITFDCYAEFWVADDADDEALYGFLRSEDFRRLDLDDRQFLDISRRLSFEVREVVLLPAQATSPGRHNKAVLMWKQGANPREVAEMAASRIVSALTDQLHFAALDVALPPVPEESPFDAFLSLEYKGSAPLAMDSSLLPQARWALVEVDPVETPPEKLAVA
tara:strand:+ start:3804 stop:4451 length:648 start_codon:yes stop_codon:yes gene_type:complete